MSWPSSKTKTRGYPSHHYNSFLVLSWIIIKAAYTHTHTPTLYFQLAWPAAAKTTCHAPVISTFAWQHKLANKCCSYSMAGSISHCMVGLHGTCKINAWKAVCVGLVCETTSLFDQALIKWWAYVGYFRIFETFIPILKHLHVCRVWTYSTVVSQVSI